MKLHSYVVARDYGFAPNPFYGVCTLATCKPRIRSIADIGDWVIGTGSKTRHRGNYLVYGMRVTGSMTFEEYWSDTRFQIKKPNLRGSKKQAFGDNIYSRGANGRWCQSNSHHSLADGRPNLANVRTDTSANRVLISDDFTYWGGSGPELPRRFMNFGPEQIDIRARRNHKNKFPNELIREFVDWYRSLDLTGYCGEPEDWCRTP